MSDRKQQADQNGTPEDVAKLYSWANLHGAKYRDFSAEWAQSGKPVRQRAEGEENTGNADFIPQRLTAAEAAAPPKAEDMGASGGQTAAQNATPHNAAADSTAMNAARQAVLNQFTQQSSQQFFRTPPAAAAFQGPVGSPGFGGGTQGASPQEFWPQPVTQENPSEPLGPPAWISDAHPPAANRLPLPPRDAQTHPPAQSARGGLQDSRARVASRWYALQGVIAGAQAPDEAQPQRAPARAPALAIFSLAGGVGKTCLAATLGRALSAQGERVLLIDTAAFGLLPFYFGARDHRVGVLRTFSPPGASAEAPVQLAALEPESMGAESAAQEALSSEVMRLSQNANRVIVDLATASGATARRILRLAPTVLVPLTPDMNSVVSVASIDAFFEHNRGAARIAQPYYVLNQFDALLPLHLDVRATLSEQLGERLLPFVIRHSPAVSEALAEGMTVIDYAPEAAVAGDFENLANWLKQLAASASHGYRGVRWSER